MVLIDFPDKDGWVHLVATTKDELHEFAEKIGRKRCWYHGARKNRPHYDIRESMIDLAKSFGAKQVNSRDLVVFLKNNYEKA